MLPIARIFVSLALLCVAVQAVDELIYSTAYLKDITPVYVESYNYADKSFLYATCEENGFDEPLNCTTTIEMSNDTRKQCNFDHLHKPNTTILLRMDNMALFLSMIKINYTDSVDTFENLTIINMDNCVTTNLVFPNLTFIYRILVYRDSFDVHMNGTEVCGEYESCLIKYNYKGERIGKPINFSPNYIIVHMRPVNPFRPEKGAYLFGYPKDRREFVAHINHVSPTGVMTDLFNVPVFLFFRTSIDHEYFSICKELLSSDNEAQCLQYDAMGHQIMNFTIEIESLSEVVGVFNLEQGGIGLLTERKNDEYGWLTVHLTLVHSDEHLINDVELHRVECESTPNFSFVHHVETEKEYCFYFACKQSHDEWTSSKYTVKCLDKQTYF